jgi:uncharacterized protein YndB with AHSA1/START domain
MTLDGSVERTADGWVVVFDRNIDKPPEKLWSALTDPERLANWLGDVEVDLRVGGKFVAQQPVRARKEYMVRNAARYGVELNNLGRQAF